MPRPLPDPGAGGLACIALHDVAPATWPQCARLLALVDAIGAGPVTLLVVPDFHRCGRVDAAAAAAFVREIDARRARGDEVALHGCVHLDEAPPPRTPLAWLRRRVLTAGEGEFATLDRDAALARLRSGLATLARAGWTVDGFVAPAWLASAGTLAALRDAGLRWTSTHTALVDLVASRRIAAPCLTASPRSAWRRALSRLWMRLGTRWLAQAPLIRLGLHPGDAEHAALLDAWRDTITTLCAARRCVTKSQALALCAAQPKDVRLAARGAA